MMPPRAILTWCAACLTIGVGAAQGEQGTLALETTWSGNVQVTGDVEVPVGGVLTILPGTTIAVAVRDGLAGGWDPRRVEIHVRGLLLVRGTPDHPVVFAPEGRFPAAVTRAKGVGIDIAARADWHGVVLHGGEDGNLHEIENARFAGAYAAVQVPRGDARISACTFLGTAVGVEVGSAYRDSRDWGVEPGIAQPLITGCRFAGCETGVYVEGAGSPSVERCVFYDCRVGIGCQRPGFARRLAEPGAVVARCALLHNELGIAAPALVHDSILAWNAAAVSVSAFHAPFSASIDHMAMWSNLLFGNARLADGEIGLDHEPVVADPRFVGPLGALSADGPALPACLALGADSPARACASDGGDLGPLGSPGVAVGGVVWQPAGAIVTRLLALPAEPAKDRRRSFTNANPGDTVGSRWWVVPPIEDGGTVDLREVFGPSIGGWLAVPVSAAPGAASSARLEINGDLQAIEVFCGGRLVTRDAGRRRFEERGAVFGLKLTEEDTLVAVRVVGWTASPRIGLSIDLGGPAPVEAAELGRLPVSRALLKRTRGEQSLTIYVGADLNWTDSARTDLISVFGYSRARPLEGSEALRVEVTGRRTLRVRVPMEWKKPLSVVLRGLRAPDGRVYRDSTPVEVR